MDHPSQLGARRFAISRVFLGALFLVLPAHRDARAEYAVCELGVWRLDLVSVVTDGEDQWLLQLPSFWPVTQELVGYPDRMYVDATVGVTAFLEPATCDTGYWCD